MSKKNGRPYKGPQFTSPAGMQNTVEGTGSIPNMLNIETGLTNLKQEYLMMMLVQAVIGGIVALGVQYYYTYRYGLLQKSIMNLGGMIAINSLLFLVLFVVCGLMMTGYFKSQGKSWASLMMPVSLLLWAASSYLIFGLF